MQFAAEHQVQMQKRPQILVEHAKLNWNTYLVMVFITDSRFYTQIKAKIRFFMSFCLIFEEKDAICS